jgi:hypothetical protein
MIRKILNVSLLAQLCWMSACAVDAPQTPDAPQAPDTGDDPRPQPDDDVRPPNNPGLQPPQQTRPTRRSVPSSRSVRGQRLHDRAVAGYRANDAAFDAQANVQAIWDAARADLATVLGNRSLADFTLQSSATSRTLSGAELVHYTLRQTIGGVPVHDTYLRLTARAERDARAATLVASSYRLIARPAVDTAAQMSRDEAVATARRHLQAGPYQAVQQEELMVRELGGELRLIWAIKLDGTPYRVNVVANGAQRGRVYREDTRVHAFDGVASGATVQNGAPGGNGEIVIDGLANLGVSASGGAFAFTDADGNFNIDAAAGEIVSARLSGTAANVFDFFGDDVLASAFGQQGVGLTLGGASDPASILAQTTAYRFTDNTRTYLLGNGFPVEILGEPLTVTVNLPDVCNAFYSPFERSINFFSAGFGCNNTAIDTVIAHEYGHFVDDMAGGIIDGGLSEGWGDLLGCYSLDTPFTGEDFFEDGGFIRSCDNDYVFPPGGFDEVHALGQAWAGFAWRARIGLQQAYGPEQGDALARALVLPSLVTNSPDIPSAVLETFLRDDDDGDLSNQTPNWDILLPAAEHHGLGFAVTPDFTPPAAVSDLQVIEANATSVNLGWTATGDDGFEGTALFYDLRFSSQPITIDNFFFASPVSAPAPGEAGTFESVTIAVPPASTVYFALMVYDDQFNVSELSNVVEATTSGGTVVYSEGAEDGLPGWTMDGLWHVSERRAAEGVRAAWYGQEDTGNYDTGNTNSGELTSPVISLAGVQNPILIFSEFIHAEEQPWDTADVTVFLADDPATAVFVPKTTGNTFGAFQPRVVPIPEFAGADIRVTFRFDTLDPIANDMEGWYVDDIRIIGEGGGGGSCAHPLCDTGEPLDPTCDSCVETVCEQDPFCCQSGWDAICVIEAQDFCGLTCDTCGDGLCEPGEDCSSCPQDCGECASCEHDLCQAGGPLDPQCDSCASTVCEQDPFCCEVLWDRICVQEAEAFCGLECEGCAHDQCNVGEALDPSCDTCTSIVCEADPYCCEQAWDSRCVTEASQICGLACETCSHDLCSTGGALNASCDPCVTAVCEDDSFCCAVAWDDRCVESAGEICGIECATAR